VCNIFEAIFSPLFKKDWNKLAPVL
jgi:hypothetical protein